MLKNDREMSFGGYGGHVIFSGTGTARERGLAPFYQEGFPSQMWEFAPLKLGALVTPFSGSIYLKENLSPCDFIRLKDSEGHSEILHAHDGPKIMLGALSILPQIISTYFCEEHLWKTLKWEKNNLTAKGNCWVFSRVQPARLSDGVEGLSMSLSLSWWQLCQS